jgi:hypothetical protein
MIYGECRRQARDLVHDLRQMIVVHGKTHRFGDVERYLPIGLAGLRLHDLAHTLDAAFLKKRGSGQEDVGVVRGLVQEQVLHHDAFHRGEARRHMLGVGVGLQDVLALDVDEG